MIVTCPHDEAVAYAERGSSVLPLYWVTNGRCACGRASCESPGKHPIPELVPHGYLDASTDTTVVSNWWDKFPTANVGIVTGAVSGFDVLDSDGAEGEHSLQLFQVEHGLLPLTVEATTGKGRHIYFTHAPGLKSRVRFLPGLDVRADDGYVVAPPSIHVSGKQYEWTLGTDEADFQPWPEALLASIRNGSTPTRRTLVPAPSDVIEDGTRNCTLASLAGTMRRPGMTQDAIEAALLKENEVRCRPPLPDHVVRGIAASIVRYEPGAPVSNERLPCTDVGNARRLVRYAKPKLRYADGLGWMFFDGCRWIQNAEADATELAKRAVERITDEMLATDLSAEEKKKYAMWWAKSQDAYRIKAALDLAKSEPEFRTATDAFDRDEYLLNVANGTLDLRTGELREHRHEDLITQVVDVAFNPSAKAPRWSAFLNQVVPDEGTRAFLRRWLGYCLTGATSEQVLVFFHGVGANGKTVLVETVRSVLGSYARTTPFTTFVQRPSDAATNDIAALAGTRMVVASEPDEGVKLSEALVKQVTGGEVVAARFLYKELFQFRPSFKVSLVGNHRPRIKGTDHGIWRRILLVPFPIIVPPEEQDRDLTRKLQDEREGILAETVRGCLEWQQTGLGPPEGVRVATAAYRDEEDVFGQFLDEECVFATGEEVSAKDLRDAYKVWCEVNGEKAVSQKWVGSRLTDRGLVRKKRRAGHVWIGIGLRR